MKAGTTVAAPTTTGRFFFPNPFSASSPSSSNSALFLMDLVYHNVLYDTLPGSGKRAKVKCHFDMDTHADPFEETTLDKAIRFQNQLISLSTGSGFGGDDREYQELRRFFGARCDTKARLPDFVRRCRDL